MDKGCIECNKLPGVEICLHCQLEHAEYNAMIAKETVEILIQKIAKEKENAKCR